MADETKKYLDYDGLAYLVQKLTNKIEAAGGGTDSHAVEVLRSVVTFPADPDTGDWSALNPLPGADDIPLSDVLKLTDDFTGAELESDDGRFLMGIAGTVKLGFTYFLSCTEKNETGSDIHATLRLTVSFSDGAERTVNVIAVQSAAATSSGGGTAQGAYVAYVDADKVNRICKPSEWSADMGTPCGAVIVAGGRNLLIGPGYLDDLDSHGSSEWPGAGVLPRFSDELQALNDFGGRENTQALNEKGGLNTAVQFCLSYSYGAVGAGMWWLPSLGELWLLYRFKDGVGEAFAATDGKTPGWFNKSILSNTDKDDLYYWTMRLWSDGPYVFEKGNDADYDQYTIPVSEWVWVDD